MLPLRIPIRSAEGAVEIIYRTLQETWDLY